MSEKPNIDNQNIIKNNDYGKNTRLLKILFWVVIAAFSFLRFNHILTIGLTTSEADVLTHFGAMRAFSFPYSFLVFSWNEPLTVILMRLVALCGEPPVYGRYVFAAVGVWSLLFIGAISRRNSNLIGALVTVIFAGISALLIVSSQEISRVSLVIWSALFVQWAFSLLRNTPKFKNIFIYFVLALVGVLFSPMISLVIIAHSFWFVIFSFQNNNDNKQKCNVYRIAAVGAFLIGTPFFVLQWMTYDKVDSMLSFSPNFSTNLLTNLSCNPSGNYLQLALFIIFSFAVLFTFIYSIVKKAGEARVWGIIVLITFTLWFFSPYKSMQPVNSSFLFPFVILLVVQCFNDIIGMLAKFRGYLGKGIKFCLIVLVIAVIVVFGKEQYKLYHKKLQSKIVCDLSGPSAFLKRVTGANDKIIFVSDINIYDWLRTRYYFYDYLTQEAKISFECVNKMEWMTNSLSYLQNLDSSLWLVGAYEPGKDYKQKIYTNLIFSYAMPVTRLTLTSKWNNFESLDLLREAAVAAPMNHFIIDQLLNWYRESKEADLKKCAENGSAGKDIASKSGSDLFKKAAANRVLYTWKECNITNFYKFDEFINKVRELGIDSNHAIHLYSIFTEKALRNTNLIIAVRAVESAKKIDPENPFLNRLAAKIESLKEVKNFDKIVDLNKRASDEYEKRYGKKFVNAQYANASAYRTISNYPKAFASCDSVLSYYADEIKMPVSIQTNLTESGKIKREKWVDNQLNWIGRCNSFISSLLCETGDYENAILWETKNLDEHNSEARRTTSRERLAKMYTQVGGIDKAFQYLDSLANSATSVNKRISWKLEGAQLYVTIGDTVSTYDRWNDLQKEIEKLKMDERWKWSKDKRYQRILRYLGGRSQMDIRNPVIVSLEKRADKETNTTASARLRVQAAEIYKCMLQYNKTDEMFDIARKTDPLFFDSYLDDGLLQYRMKRYAKAEKIFTNVIELIKVSDTNKLITQDWRYIILDMLVEKGIPPSLDNVLSKIDETKPYLNDLSEYYNHYGNVLACYGKYDMATNQFTIGIQTNKLNLQNYLDLGYLICRHSDAERAGKMIDTIMSLNLSEEKKRLLETDWRFIILHHVSVRPYNLKE